MTNLYPVPRVGICNVCGRQSTGYLKVGSLRECEDPCPRCGASPLYLDGIGPYTENIATMSVSDAIQTIQTDIGNPAEMEAAFRIEVAGHPPGGRREVLEAAYRQYWVLAQFDDPGQRAKILSLDEAIEAWKRELENPDVRRYYTGLILSQASHAKVAPARMRRLAAKLGGVK